MSHSIQTHRRSYEEIGTAAHAAKARKVVQQLTEVEQPTPKYKKMFWTAPQISLIEEFFKQEICQLAHATTDKCKSFLRMHAIEGRTPKHVQDKVKGIIDKCKLPQI